MKQILSVIALLAAFTLLWAVPALAGDADPVTGFDKEAYKKAVDRWGGYAITAVQSGAIVPERGDLAGNPLLWHPRFGALTTTHEREMKTSEAIRGLLGPVAFEEARMCFGPKG